jgi:hypothetical protein
MLARKWMDNARSIMEKIEETQMVNITKEATVMADSIEAGRWVHTSIWALTKSEARGCLLDGPVFASIFNSLQGLTLVNPDEFADVQNKYVVYHDDTCDYSTNEPTMDGTAGSILMMAHWAPDIR